MIVEEKNKKEKYGEGTPLETKRLESLKQIAASREQPEEMLKDSDRLDLIRNSIPPAELDMEETYFYLFDKVGADAGTPNEGFGFQSVYTPEGVVAKKFGERLNEAYRVSSYDTVAIAEGYHPLVGAPGYNMYYLWTMAGDKGRGLVSSMDPAHAWVKNS